MGIIYMVRNVARSLVIQTLATIALLGAGQVKAAEPKLFFYPPGYHLSDGSWVPTTLTNNLAEITSDFPVVQSMGGVVVVIYWSRLCPTANSCDFGLIKEVLDYWRARGKRVVLSVPTVGFPAKQMTNSVVSYETATPRWVLDQVRTYKHTSTMIPTAQQSGPNEFDFPVYDDPRFLEFVQSLVGQLGRFDGDPVISQVRISTGFQSEDNPSLEGLRWSPPSMSAGKWLDYCKTMTNIFSQAFSKSQLEFDLGRISWIKVNRESGLDTETDSFVQSLIRRRIFLAFNGLSSRTQAPSSLGPETTTGPSQSLSYLLLARNAHDSTGLEVAQPLYTSEMRDLPHMAEVLSSINPDRLVFFGDAAAAMTGDDRSATFSSSPGLRASVRHSFETLVH